MSKVSVIIPCYNSARFVHAAIESVLAQTMEELELICINDGSTDDTLQVLQERKNASGDRIPFVIIDQPNTGACASRNRGLKLAVGTYVQFLDADDTLLPEKIERQYRMACDGGFPEIVVGSYQRVDEQGRLMLERRYSDASAEGIPELLMNTNLGITSSNLFYRESLVRIGGWNEELGSSQEYDLMFRLIEGGGRILFDGQVNTCILDRSSGSISKSNRGDNWRRYVDLRIRMLDYILRAYPERDLSIVYQALFNGLRSLYRYDPEKAIALRKQYIPSSFSPQTGRAYRALYSLFGMGAAEKVTGLFRTDK